MICLKIIFCSRDNIAVMVTRLRAGWTGVRIPIDRNRQSGCGVDTTLHSMRIRVVFLG
jgi:hypothetical protein